MTDKGNLRKHKTKGDEQKNQYLGKQINTNKIQITGIFLNVNMMLIILYHDFLYIVLVMTLRYIILRQR